MAWIKITHETPDKPEIIRMAEILNIDQDAVSGKCLRVWIWADQQTISGDDLIVTSSFLDRLTNCSGFSAALLEVRWLKSRNGRFSLPNFDRHNGQTAKNRALSADRMQRQRYAQNVTETAPELEKEIEKEKKRKRVRGVLAHVDPSNLPPAPPDPPNLEATKAIIQRFIPPAMEEVIAYCRDRGKGVDAERWWDFYASKGWMVGKNKMKDWQAACRTWEPKNGIGKGNTGGYESTSQREARKLRVNLGLDRPPGDSSSPAGVLLPVVPPDAT
jgi:hypothetical protein